jgi:hypothetical protein
MNADEAVVALVGVLESLAIPYMVSGSLATNVYGVPRSTDDGVGAAGQRNRIGRSVRVVAETLNAEQIPCR